MYDVHVFVVGVCNRVLVSHPNTPQTPTPPSPQIFYAFDELLLLKRGGQTIFNGPLGTNASLLVKYFESNEGVPRFDQHDGPKASGVHGSSTSTGGINGGVGGGKGVEGSHGDAKMNGADEANNTNGSNINGVNTAYEANNTNGSNNTNSNTNKQGDEEGKGDDTFEARNAADWMLEVTSVDAATRLGVDFAEVFRESDLARCVWGGGVHMGGVVGDGDCGCVLVVVRVW